MTEELDRSVEATDDAVTEAGGSPTTVPEEAVSREHVSAAIPEELARDEQTSDEVPEELARDEHPSVAFPEELARGEQVSAAVPEELARGEFASAVVPDELARNEHPSAAVPEELARDELASAVVPDELARNEHVSVAVPEELARDEQASRRATDASDTEAESDSDTEDDTDAPESDAPRVSKREEALTNEGEIAADYLEELLDIADLDGDIDTFNEGGRAHVSILTDSDVLVGKKGEVLDALQELARLAVMTETGHRSRLMLDIAGHRDKQRSSLQDLAADAVAEVTSTGEPVRLSPMNPFERKIVHDAIAAAGLVSESEGEEPHRRVVVLPKG